jgi:DNA-binding transcriptional MerR regulator
MRRVKDLERIRRIRELRDRGLSLREIAQDESISVAAVHRTLRPSANPDQYLEDRIKALEDRISFLEGNATLTKEFFEIVAKMSGFLGSTFRDQLTTVLRRWPQPMVTIHLAHSPSDSPKFAAVPRDLVLDEDL